MTKTLTEQWRDGKLPEGYYYIKGAFDDDIYISHLDYEIEEDKRLPVEEVVATVPSYDEWQAELGSNDELLNVQKRLEKKLEIATKALKDMPEMSRAQRALREMEGVK